jgi:hypothetical protein
MVVTFRENLPEGRRGVIAFSVGGATQYYEVSNILVMTFETEGTDAPDTPGRQPSIIPDPGSLQRQKLHGKTDHANTRGNQQEISASARFG